MMAKMYCDSNHEWTTEMIHISQPKEGTFQRCVNCAAVRYITEPNEDNPKGVLLTIDGSISGVSIANN